MIKYRELRSTVREVNKTRNPCFTIKLTFKLAFQEIKHWQQNMQT